MKLGINHKKLIESPYTIENDRLFVFEDLDCLERVANEFSEGTPACYLISGYRGVGKTSFIKKIETLGYNSNSNLSFINVNLSKYASYTITLRKIIREIYLQTANTDVWSKFNDEDKVKIERLFKRTFNNVSQKETDEVTNRKENILKISFNLKDYFLLVLTVALSVNLIFGVVLFENINLLLVVLSLTLDFFSWINFEQLNKKISNNSKKITIEEYYDDEIAEYYLIDLLSSISKNGIKIIFVIDEVDKVNREDIEKLVSELKPVILSGYASFIFVSGQSMYYKIKESISRDDSMMSSIFSKIIHVPLMTDRSFESLFNNLLKDGGDKKKYKYFLDSIILESQRIPRKFINIIRSNLVWENDAAYIEILDSSNSANETDSTILAIINKLTEDDKIAYFDSSARDFFVNQLFLWNRQIKQYKKSQFTVEMICKTSDYVNDYPREFISSLNDICTSLVEEMCKANLLEMLPGKEDLSNSNSSFRWKRGVNTITRNVYENDEIKTKFLEEFIDLEKYVRGIYGDIFGDGSASRKSINIMIKGFVNEKVISSTWLTSNRFSMLIDFRNTIVHGSEINNVDLDMVQEFKYILSRFKAELIEGYFYYITSSYLKPKGFVLEKGLKVNRDMGVDYIAHLNKMGIRVLFEIKSGNIFATGRTFSQIQRVSEYLSANKNDYFVLFTYLTNRSEQLDNTQRKMNQMIGEKFPGLEERIMIFYIPEYRDDVRLKRLTVCLEKVLEKVFQKENEGNSGSAKKRKSSTKNSIQSSDFDNIY